MILVVMMMFNMGRVNYENLQEPDGNSAGYRYSKNDADDVGDDDRGDGCDDDHVGDGDDDNDHVENAQDPDGIPSRVPIWTVPPPRLPLPKVRMVCHELRTTIATCCLQPLE